MKLLTVNIEGHKHLDLVTNLITEEQPDVICLQEVFESDVLRIQQAFDQPSQLVTMHSANAVVLNENEYGIAPMGNWGIAILIRKSLLRDEEASFNCHFYVGAEQTVPEFTSPHSPRRSLLAVRASSGGQTFEIATTHFTWTPNGQSSPQQHNDVKQLKLNMGIYNRFILCGDFNAPRGGEIYTQLAEGLVDHIPRDVLTTLDHRFHYAGMLNLVVDGVLSTPDISSINTRVIDGVSDHKAIIVEFSLH